MQVMCRLLEVLPSGFYAWVKRPLSDRAIEDRRLLVLIRASYTASGGVYGYRRVHLDLCEIGEACGKHRVARIMRTNHIKARHGYKIPRGIYGRPSIIAPNKLQRRVYGRSSGSRLCDGHHLQCAQPREASGGRCLSLSMSGMQEDNKGGRNPNARPLR